MTNAEWELVWWTSETVKANTLSASSPTAAVEAAKQLLNAEQMHEFRQTHKWEASDPNAIGLRGMGIRKRKA